METVLSGLCSNAWAPHEGPGLSCAEACSPMDTLRRTGQLKEMLTLRWQALPLKMCW